MENQYEIIYYTEKGKRNKFKYADYKSTEQHLMKLFRSRIETEVYYGDLLVGAIYYTSKTVIRKWHWFLNEPKAGASAFAPDAGRMGQ